MAVKGLDTVLRNIAQYAKKRAAERQKALTKIGLKVLGDAIKLTPVDTSNLRNSGDMRIVVGKVFVFFTADYAFYVHEDMEAKHEVGEAKYLTKAVTKNRDFIVKELAR